MPYGAGKATSAAGAADVQQVAYCLYYSFCTQCTRCGANACRSKTHFEMPRHVLAKSRLLCM